MLSDSMATLVEVADRAALLAHVRRKFSDFGPTFADEQMHVEPYSNRPDERIGWNATYIVTLEGYGVVGFTDGPL